MSGGKRPPQSELPSLTYRSNKVKEASSALTDYELQQHDSKQTEKTKQGGLNVKSKSPEILSTTELISAVGQIWDHVNRLSVPESKEKPDRFSNGSQTIITLSDLLTKEVNVEASKDDGGRSFSIDVRVESNITTLAQPKLGFLTVTQKLSMFEPCSRKFSCSLFQQFLKGTARFSNESWKGKGLTSLGISYDMKKIYGRMKEIIPAETQYPVNVTKIIDKTTDNICHSGSTISSSEGCIPRDAADTRNKFSSRRVDFYCDSFKSNDVSSLGDNMNVAMQTGSVSSLCSDYFLGALHDNNIIGTVPGAPSSTLYADYHISMLDPHRTPLGTFQHNAEDDKTDEYIRKKPHEFAVEDKYSTDIQSLACERPHNGLDKQQHAYAGAFAGIFVSLCLHPVDTIKTVTQSYRGEQKSVFDVGKSIVSERGVTGLYRGIASKIASSAPISAIYTFTYESVKGSLLPLFSKEYQSLAHCMAGGSASIATSFVFTPSECIKQQMQIGSRYHNCWNALIGIIGNGGFSSLYTGWGAVLCRNVPHSVIKFYTYESLKQLILPSQNSTAQTNTLQTLVCGGLAGSTAALFTTPFDVVKTRLQIQIHGSMSQYDGVFHALKEIGKKEGLKGLYRGLIPRLIMYASQGALFFTSYEFFKRLFSLEISQFGAQ